MTGRFLPPRLISRRYEAGVTIPAAVAVLIAGKTLPNVWFWPVAAVIAAAAFFLVLRPLRAAEKVLKESDRGDDRTAGGL